jgi:spore germination protein YaaH
VYGYLQYWTLDKIKYFQLDKLTDIAYFGLNINADGTFRKVIDDGTGDPGYDTWRNSEELTNLIEKVKPYNTRMAVTIISHSDDISDKFLACRTCWDTFLTSLYSELDYRKVINVNLNFEYVELTTTETAQKYTEFTDFVNRGIKSKYGEKAFLVVATFADSLVKARVTNIESIAKVSDGLFIMGYDFHHSNSNNAGPVSPLGGIGTQSDYDIQTMVKDYLTVADSSKLIMGLPYYGYNWVVEKEEDLAKRVPGDDENGFSQSQTYSDIMDTILKVKPEVKWNELSQSPYFTYTSPDTGAIRQVYYEDVKSLKLKYELAKNSKFGGVGMWALGYDGGYTDFWDLLGTEFFSN